MEKQGNIKISSENMMPIIKKWLYSDKDIFLREIVANGIDAVTKFKKLADMGEASVSDGEEFCVKVYTDEKAKTLTVEDNGIGMTADEVEKYITQIAFSGAADFLAKYEKTSGDGIIGHFGLGFYSAYMVSSDIEIFTKSYKDEPAVYWESDGDAVYKMGDTDKAPARGTKIVMHIAEGEEEFLKEATVRQLLNKYCSFMPYNIYLNYNEKEKDKNKPINTTSPLYLKNPSECTEDEYKDFYRETFMDYNEPLFWIHLNMEYPFRLKGILYFPKVKKQVELEKGKVKLYCNQVFIADNIKEVIPEFMMLLNGVIDCPDIPLNVSRSFLQNDRQVQKISKYITKKVADVLTDLFKKDRAKYENCWKDISTFIKFGCIKDDEFYQKVKDIIIFKNLNDEFKPLSENFGEEVSEDDAKNGKEPKAVYYVSDKVQQAQYINMFKGAGLDAILCDTYIDPHFISYIEYKNPRSVRFLRIDADIDGALKSEIPVEEDKELEDIFKNNLVNKNCKVKIEALKNSNVAGIINVAEFMRRMSEMNTFYGMSEDGVMEDMTLIVNANNSVVSAIKTLPAEKQAFVVNHIYYLALMAHKKLSADELKAFTSNNMALISTYAGVEYTPEVEVEKVSPESTSEGEAASAPDSADEISVEEDSSPENN